MVDDDASGTDVVNEIFARLRKATLEERGAAPVPKRAAPAPAKAVTATGELFERRDAALGESLSVLTRKVKRALQDDQNIMLERLRDVKAMITTELEDEHEQRARYADAAIDALTDAAAAGVQFAKDEAGVGGGEVDDAALEGLRGRSRGDDRAWRCESASSPTGVVTVRTARTPPTRSGEARASNDCAPTPRAGPSRSASSPPRRVATSDSSSRRTTPRVTRAPWTRRRVSGPPVRPFPSGSAYPPLHAGCACAVIPV